MTLLLLALIAALQGPAGAHPEVSRIRSNRQRVQEIRQELEQARKVQADQAAALARAQQHVAAVMEAVVTAEQAVDRQRQAVEAARRRLEELQVVAARQQEALRQRAVTLYRHGASVPFADLMASQSPSEAVERSTYLDIINRSDQRTLQNATIGQRAVAAQQEELGQQERILARALEEQRVLLAEAEKVRQHEAVQLAATSGKISDLQSQERHLQAESRKLAALARRSSSTTARAGGSAAVSSGGWTWPARGPVTSEYGRRWGRMHEGIDIGAGHGAPVVAARAGVVTHTGRMSGYGLMTLVDHGGGVVTAYAHQSKIVVSSGQRVAMGERIGGVGCSGSCTGPHLHFEVRVGGSPRNPRNYLP